MVFTIDLLSLIDAISALSYCFSLFLIEGGIDVSLDFTTLTTGGGGGGRQVRMPDSTVCAKVLKPLYIYNIYISRLKRHPEPHLLQKPPTQVLEVVRDRRGQPAETQPTPAMKRKVATSLATLGLSRHSRYFYDMALCVYDITLWYL